MRVDQTAQVAVKVLHPGIVSSTALDMALLRFLASTLTWLCPSLAWLNLQAGVAEFQTLLEAQLDLRTEAANLLRFRENFSTVDSVEFPQPVTRLCGRSVLVEEWLEGDSIQNYLSTTDRQSLTTRTPDTAVFMSVFTIDYLFPCKAYPLMQW